MLIDVLTRVLFERLTFDVGSDIDRLAFGVVPHFFAARL
jgi:hypothetical protein